MGKSDLHFALFGESQDSDQYFYSLSARVPLDLMADIVGLCDAYNCSKTDAVGLLLQAGFDSLSQNSEQFDCVRERVAEVASYWKEQHLESIKSR